MNFRPFQNESKFSTFMYRLAELVLLNIVFLITCIPIFTIGAAISALYNISIKMVRKEESYVIRGYFKAFKASFKQATAFWLIAMLLYFILYVVDMAANINGGTLARAYVVICIALALLYSFYFLFAFALISTFENTFKNTVMNTFGMIVAYFPKVLCGYLCVAIPFIISFGVSVKIMTYASLFWIIIGFSVLFLWQSVYLNKIFDKYIEGAEETED